jgi:hypothetical protein
MPLPEMPDCRSLRREVRICRQLELGSPDSLHPNMFRAKKMRREKRRI